MKKRKIGELRTASALFVIYFESDKGLYRLVRKWYENGWHQETEITASDLFTITNWITAYVRCCG